MLHHNRLAVVIPTFNRRYCLERAIDSVLQQTLQPAEIIVVDDGSTDGTEVWLRKSFPQVLYVRQNNQGVSSARNLGIYSTNKSWIAFLDSDDAWHPEKIERQLNRLQEQPEFLIAHTDEIWIRNGRRVNLLQKYQKQGGWIFQQCLSVCAIAPSSVIIHRDVFNQVGGFDETLQVCEDYDLWLRITAQFPVLYIDEALTIKYGGHEDQLSKQIWGMDRYRIKALQKIIQRKILPSNDQQAAVRMLFEKISIYLNGARKRNKFDEVEYYQQLLEQYTEPA